MKTQIQIPLQIKIYLFGGYFFKTKFIEEVNSSLKQEDNLHLIKINLKILLLTKNSLARYLISIVQQKNTANLNKSSILELICKNILLLQEQDDYRLYYTDSLKLLMEFCVCKFNYFKRVFCLVNT